MSILGGSFETFFVFLCISVEPQHRDKIPQLRLITLYIIHHQDPYEMILLLISCFYTMLLYQILNFYTIIFLLFLLVLRKIVYVMRFLFMLR